jgi:hypothetical protein
VPAPSNPVRVDAPLSARADLLAGRPSADLLARLREVERHLADPGRLPRALSQLRAERDALREMLIDRRDRARR